MRSNSTQLPSYQELCDILAYEAVRQIPQEKQYSHYGDFSSIIDLLKHYELATNFFEEDLHFEAFKEPERFDEVTALFADLAQCIVETQDDQTSQKLFDALYEYLSETDPLQSADLIFVFGSTSTLRTEKAIRLYQQGYAPRIMISGRGAFYDSEAAEKPEVERLAAYAVSCGVPLESLIIETQSITVPDNVKRSLALLEAETIPHGRIILVNSPFCQRRGWAHFNKMSFKDTQLIRCNSDSTSEKYSKDGWYKNEEGIKVILKEFFGLRMSHILNTS